MLLNVGQILLYCQRIGGKNHRRGDTMQMTIDVGYEQVVQLFWQLPPRERTRFVREVVPTESEPVLSEDEPRPDLIVLERGDGYSIVQVPFPDTKEGRIRQKAQEQLQRKYRETHPAILGRPKCSREKWKQILANAPTLTPEEVQEWEESMKNFRKEFNDDLERRCLRLVGSD